jgi:hypothetical protein
VNWFPLLACVVYLLYITFFFHSSNMIGPVVSCAQFSNSMLYISIRYGLRSNFISDLK